MTPKSRTSVYLIRAVVLVASGSIFAVVSLVCGLEFLTPGQLLIPAGVFTVTAILPMAAFAGLKYPWTGFRATFFRRRLRLSGQTLAIAAACSALLLVALVVIGRYDTSIRILRSLPSAAEYFSVTEFGRVGDFPRDLTLTKLAEIFPTLRAKYDLNHSWNGILQVYLYPTARDFQRIRGLPSWIEGEFEFRNGKPTIDVPCNATYRTIAHELTHGVVGGILGQQKMNSIPRWFNEALAEVEGRRRLSKLEGRIRLWLAKGRVESYADFISLDMNDRVESELFYDASYELWVYIEGSLGENVAGDLVESLRAGRDFDVAVRTVTTFDPQELYAAWTRHFFGIGLPW
jgi:hypothetical protein